MSKRKHIEWEILTKKATGTLTPAEESAFQEWLLQDKKHQIYFERVKKAWTSDETTLFMQSDLPKVISQFDAFVEKKLRKSRSIKRFYRYAAACLIALLLTGGGIWILYDKSIPSPETINANTTILPGGNKALILLDNGEKIDVRQLADSIHQMEGIDVALKEGKIRYSSNSLHPKTKYNTIIIPRGGEYQVELSDGTKIWLNAETQLKIPTTFTGKERRVFLKGEAYFEVAKNDKQPFVVETSMGEVKVYGTQFNVKFYPEDKEIRTTLVEGSISFKNQQIAELKIKPGYQLQLKEHSSTPEIKHVKIHNEIAWKNRMFSFESERLEDIAKKLERWYNVTIVFEDEDLKNFKFSGNLSRYDTIDKILFPFEEVFHAKFLIEENGIIKVTKK